ncbi:MAG: hypothetical protein H6840_09840 [Planctomycetes bacterium]|nr:hypothetical protein [Planctomycetota bacterium]
MSKSRKPWRANAGQGKAWVAPPLTVVDINVLRNRNVVLEAGKAAYELRGAVLVPIITFAELVKHEHKWAETLCGSLVELASVSEVLLCGAELSHIMAKERVLGAPIVEYADRAHTAALRAIVERATQGVAAVRDFLGKWDAVNHIRNDAAFLRDHTENKWSLGRAVTAIGDCLSGDDLKALRRGNVERRRELIAESAYHAACKEWPDRASNPRRSASYMRNSIESRLLMYEAAVPLLWLAEGGFENRKDVQVSNDFADAWYAILGSLTGRLRSNDCRVVQLAEDISAASKMVGLCEPGDWCTKLDEWIDPDLIRLMGENAARVLKKTYDVRAHPEKYFNEVPTWLKKS